MNKIAILIVRFYRLLISPLFPSSCRYYPTCSEYTIEAFQTHPGHKALWISAKRIGRCHPWHDGGFDPVPTPEEIGTENG
ncbi:MAG: membrane protein insertion efficiency factor YidD [Candidatus Marinimicrobia bacterium]|nr:membrane protein insertion efficiency factor YidD [Candidatus Neomarinimicrobiota bacterium]MCF7829118.1 membrane protein insertion efficiency factor YidD [Candidatus Neomarinimicrobiota bacterium]MCF7881483.1 membrane protein insertion efficiency factor YidD [Candidatus Neomarinimicrobiota bacterium]